LLRFYSDLEVEGLGLLMKYYFKFISFLALTYVGRLRAAINCHNNKECTATSKILEAQIRTVNSLMILEVIINTQES
jgi:hypothetical protein